MAKFDIKDNESKALAKFLTNEITLMERGLEHCWVEYSEISDAISQGFSIFNDNKREFYDSIKDKPV